VNYQESPERLELRKAVAALAGKYGRTYFQAKARAGEKTDELWNEAGRLGYLGVNLPEEYGGGGGGLGDLAAVCEELAAAGCPLLLMVVSPAICGTIISRFGTDEQRKRWLPGLADGSTRMAFAITEPDAGSNAHRITTTARRDGGDWVLSGQKVFISGVDEAQAVLVVGRTENARPDGTSRLQPALFVVPTDATGLTTQLIPMDLMSPEKQFTMFLDDVRLPADALVGDADAALLQLFAGLNPERIMAASFSIGAARYALGRAVEYARTRTVFKVPIGAHQAIAHPLADSAINLEMVRLITQKAAAIYDSGDDAGAGEAANMAKYAAAEMACAAVDRAIQTFGGNAFTTEYGLAAMAAAMRLARVAPVTREMVLNFVAEHTLGLPKSY
jgi:alkylation response protein AidB-like acyl-CoA dehydrogenase